MRRLRETAQLSPSTLELSNQSRRSIGNGIETSFDEFRFPPPPFSRYEYLDPPAPLSPQPKEESVARPKSLAQLRMQLKAEREAEGKLKYPSSGGGNSWAGPGPAAKSHLKELTRLMEGARTEAGKNFSQLLKKLENIKQVMKTCPTQPAFVPVFVLFTHRRGGVYSHLLCTSTATARRVVSLPASKLHCYGAFNSPYCYCISSRLRLCR